MDRRIGKVDVDETVEDGWRVSEPIRQKNLWDGGDDDATGPERLGLVQGYRELEQTPISRQTRPDPEQGVVHS